MDTESNPCSISTPVIKLLIEECLIDIINKTIWWDCMRYHCNCQMNMHTFLKFELSPLILSSCLLTVRK